MSILSTVVFFRFFLSIVSSRIFMPILSAIVFFRLFPSVVFSCTFNVSLVYYFRFSLFSFYCIHVYFSSLSLFAFSRVFFFLIYPSNLISRPAFLYLFGFFRKILILSLGYFAPALLLLLLLLLFSLRVFPTSFNLCSVIRDWLITRFFRTHLSILTYFNNVVWPVWLWVLLWSPILPFSFPNLYGLFRVNQQQLESPSLSCSTASSGLFQHPTICQFFLFFHFHSVVSRNSIIIIIIICQSFKWCLSYENFN